MISPDGRLLDNRHLSSFDASNNFPAIKSKLSPFGKALYDDLSEHWHQKYDAKEGVWVDVFKKEDVNVQKGIFPAGANPPFYLFLTTEGQTNFAKRGGYNPLTYEKLKILFLVNLGRRNGVIKGL